MATRNRKNWKLDNQGQYPRQIGWKLANGRYTQHKFRLGNDLKAAKLRTLKLQELWDHLEARASANERAVWTANALEIAKQIAKGQTQIVLKRLPKDTEQSYARWLRRVQRHFPMVSIVAEDPQCYLNGKRLNDELVQGQVDAIVKLHLRNGNIAEAQILTKVCGTLHQALDAYLAEIKRTVIDIPNPRPSGKTRYGNVERLIERHPDKPLDSIGFDEIQQMADYWKNRPNVKGTNRPVARKTVTNHISEMIRFFGFIHKSKKFSWRKPEDFDELDLKVPFTTAEIQAKETPRQVATWTLDELCTLFEYATPLERLVMLLGLNCGFGAAEQGSLLRRQIFFDHRHETSAEFGLEGSENFIKRIRIKNTVYGEHLLWRHTVTALRWALEHRFPTDSSSSEAELFVRKDRTPWWQEGRKAKPGHRFSNVWKGLVSRVRRDREDFPSRSLGKLRKTGGDLVRRMADGEVAATFLCHGKPVTGDDLSEVYSNRPFGKLFAANRAVEQYLAPMFAKAPDPVAQYRQQYLPRNITTKLLELYDAGRRPKEIAAELKVAPSTVYRTLEASGRRTNRERKAAIERLSPSVG